MNWIFLGIGVVASVGLSSCGGMSGEQVDEPSVDKMSQLESQWGMKPRKAQPRGNTMQIQENDNTSTPEPTTPPTPEPPAVAPAPQLAPQPQASTEVDSPPPNLTTLQKLR
jgi:hypothetical protein